jgi:hypothetical protein
MLGIASATMARCGPRTDNHWPNPMVVDNDAGEARVATSKRRWSSPEPPNPSDAADNSYEQEQSLSWEFLLWFVPPLN